MSQVASLPPPRSLELCDPATLLDHVPLPYLFLTHDRIISYANAAARGVYTFAVHTQCHNQSFQLIVSSLLDIDFAAADLPDITNLIQYLDDVEAEGKKWT